MSQNGTGMTEGRGQMTEQERTLFAAGAEFARRQVSLGELRPDEWMLKNLSSYWVNGYFSVYSVLSGFTEMIRK